MKKRILVVLLIMIATVLLLSSCDFDFVTDLLPQEHVHEYGKWNVTTEATCTENGMMCRECECGEKECQTISATGHTESEWITKSTPNCIGSGEKYKECTVCHKILDKETISASGHSHTSVVTEPTCTEQGYTTHTCHCGDTYVDSYVEANGHSYGDWTETLAPTCTEKGEERRDCANCDNYETREVAASGHSFTDTVIAPTCTSFGYSIHVCDCGYYYLDCLESIIDHDYGEWYETLSPNCMNKGEERRDCKNCNYYETRELEVNGHVYGEWIDEISATCTESGTLSHYHCSVCHTNFDIDKNELSDLTIEKTGHKYENGACIKCTELQPDSEGLQLILNADRNGYVVLGMGDCKDTYIVIPSEYKGLPVVAIDAKAFRYTDIVGVRISKNIKSIGDHAFCDCHYLTSVMFVKDSTLSSVGSCAFINCLKLTDITLPDSIGYISSSAFIGTAYYNNEQNWEDGVLYIGNHLIQAKTDVWGDYSIKEDTITIAEHAFYDCTKIINIYIPYGVKSIGSYAFNCCNNLANITIPDSVILIGSYAFSNCNNLASITISRSVESIGNGAFSECTALTEINYNAENCDDLSSNNKLFYNAGNNGDGIKVTIGANVKKIPSYLFYPDSPYYSPKIVEIVFEEGSVCGNIGNHAFYYCKSITSITVPNSVKLIGNNAFYYCSGLTSVYYNGTIDQWIEISFEGEASNPLRYAKNLYINNELVTEAKITTATKISDYAFIGCSSLTSISIPESVTSIGSYAFSGCTNLTGITIPNSVTSIGSCYSPEELTIINYTGTKDEWDSIKKEENWYYYRIFNLDGWRSAPKNNYVINYNYSI